MAKCEALTKKGEPCRIEAVEGNAFCAVHQNYAGVLAGEEAVSVAPVMEVTTAVFAAPITTAGPLRVRYKGSGVYLIGTIRFTEKGQVVEVEPWMHAHLTKLPRFEDATQ